MTKTDQQYGSVRIIKSFGDAGVFYDLKYFTDGEKLEDLSNSQEEIYIVRNVNAMDYESEIISLCRLASDGRMDKGVKISEDDLKESLDKLLVGHGGA